MIGYIRQPLTGEIVQSVNITSYNLPIETFQGETGTINIVGDLNGDYSRFILYIPDLNKCFKITSDKSGNGTETRINVSDDISLVEGSSFIEISSGETWFRNLRFCYIPGIDYSSPNSSNYVPDYIYLNSEWNYIDRSNEEYNRIIRWFRNVQIPVDDFDREDVSTGSTKYYLYSTDNVLRVLRSYGAEISFGYNEEWIDSTTEESIFIPVLLLTFGELGFDSVIPVFFNDGHSELISESYNNDICSCVCLATGNSNKTNYYLKSDLTVSTDKTEQIPGYTTFKFIRNGTQADAEEIFLDNTYSHKIEFASDKKFRLGQPVKLVLKSGILDTSISKVMLKSGDDRFHYVCGELPVTASDKIKSEEWTYCKRLPNNPRKGQLFLVPE